MNDFNAMKLNSRLQMRRRNSIWNRDTMTFDACDIETKTTETQLLPNPDASSIDYQSWEYQPRVYLHQLTEDAIDELRKNIATTSNLSSIEFRDEPFIRELSPTIANELFEKVRRTIHFCILR